MSFADVRDVAQAALQALTRGEPSGRHLMGVNMSMSEFFHRLERLTGVPAPRVRLPRLATIAGAHLLDRVAAWRGTKVALDPQEVEVGEHWFWVDPAKARTLLGYQARDPYETLHDTVQDVLSRLPPSERPGLKGSIPGRRGT